jgi:acyl carrier protein
MALTYDEALKTTISIIAEEFAIDANTLHADSQLTDDLELDSLDTVAVVSRLRYELDVALDETDLADTLTLGDLARKIVAKQKG